ncbi:MAG: hypothetical protein HQL12_08195 [Candidatus Omnitrophica bacterium]|nr:hypothetical protein [Candidatus Omnitrophota bacterium]
MRKLLVITILFLFFCNGLAFAGDTAQKTTTLEANTTAKGVVGAIVNTVKKLDEWVQNTLW